MPTSVKNPFTISLLYLDILTTNADKIIIPILHPGKLGLREVK